MSLPQAHEAPSITLHSGTASARVYLDGAHVTSWIPTNGEEQLFVSARAMYGPGVAIRGGIPVCWPQFGAFGPLRQHGFARLQRWTLAEQVDNGPDGARAVLHLSDSQETRAIWPHAFHAEIDVRIAAAKLSVMLTVINTGEAPYTFTGALHPYFRVRHAFLTTVGGLIGNTYRDALADGGEFTHDGAPLRVTGPIDRIYFGAAASLELREPHRMLFLEQKGFTDSVVWNPGEDGTRSREDFVPGEETDMVCVEAAVLRPAITLQPAGRWSGTQTMRVSQSAI